MNKYEEIKPGEEFYRCYKNIGIIGSFGKQLQDIKYAKKIFEDEGFTVLAPKDTEISEERSLDGFLILENDEDSYANGDGSPAESQTELLSLGVINDYGTCPADKCHKAEK